MLTKIEKIFICLIFEEIGEFKREINRNLIKNVDYDKFR